MSRLGWFAGACLALAPGVASAGIFETLKAEDLCGVGADGVERIEMRTVLAETLKANPIPKGLEEFGPGSPEAGPRKTLAEVVLAAGPCGPDKCAGAQAVNSEVYDVLERRKAGSLELVWIGPGPPPTNLEGRYLAFLNPDGGYDMRCTPGTRLTPEAREARRIADEADKRRREALGPWTRFAVAQDVDAAGKDFKQRTPAQFSLKSDQEAGSDSYSIKGAIVWGDVLASKASDRMTPEERREANDHLALAPYLAFNRQTSDDPKKAIDDLTFGVKLEGRLTPTRPFYVTASWVTDGARRESSMARLEAKVPFTFGGGGYLNGAVTPDRFTVLALARMNLVLDYAEVGDPGDKAGLLTVKRYQRTGLDLEGALRFGKGENDPSWLLSANYQVRDDFSDHGGDAQMLSIGLELRPSDTSHFSFGVTYERGETLDTLTETDVIKASLGYRR